jgi:DmsE family decaheme c-type cytochrome
VGERNDRRRARVGAAAALFGAALVACALAWTPSGPRRTAPIAGAARIGAAECEPCHEEVRGHAKIAAYHADCEACHGGGSVHAESEERADVRFPSVSDCLVCHAAGRDTHLAWGTGEHSRAGLLCSDCHDPHETTRRHLRPAKTTAFAPAAFTHLDDASRLCVECHDDVAARFTFPSRHPVREGMMACTSCHDPHEDRRVALGDRTQLCAGCHQDYMGPWVYEHLPVAEDCTECHDPHGAAAEPLLETPQPVICLECHSIADLWHHSTAGTGIRGNTTISEDSPPPGSGQSIGVLEARTFLRNCTNCHGAIHGSYSDPTLQH